MSHHQKERGSGLGMQANHVDKKAEIYDKVFILKYDQIPSVYNGVLCYYPAH